MNRKHCVKEKPPINAMRRIDLLDLSIEHALLPTSLLILMVRTHTIF